MPFITKLQMEHIDRTETYFLLSDLDYMTWAGKKHTTHKGFASDGHSIPKIVRGIVGSPFATKHPRPAFYHDDLLVNYVRKGLMTQFEAASEYSHAMKDDGASTFKRKAYWLGVRFGDYWHNLKRKFRRKK